MYEISGNGEIWCTAGWDADTIDAPSQGHAVSVYTIDELPNQKYRLLLCLEIDGENAGDCLILEFYNGDWTVNPIVPGHLKLISRVGGAETVLKTVGAGGSDPSGGFRGGRCISLKYISDEVTIICGSSTATSMLDTLPQICVGQDTLDDLGVSVSAGCHAGLGNTSGNEIPIQVDDFMFYRLRFRESDGGDLTKPSVLSETCFTCLCLCAKDGKFDLFPNQITLHVWGQCTRVDGQIFGPYDETFSLRIRNDCLGPWESDVVDFNGHNVTWKMICGMQISMVDWFYTPGGTWTEDMTGEGYTWVKTFHECSPYREKWTLTLTMGAASTWPGCCSTCTGVFYFEAW